MYKETTILKHLTLLSSIYMEDLTISGPQGGKTITLRDGSIFQVIDQEVAILKELDISPNGEKDGWYRRYSPRQIEYARYLYEERLLSFMFVIYGHGIKPGIKWLKLHLKHGSKIEITKDIKESETTP